MAGLYIHIPFCRKLCYYCDFYFTVSFKHKDALLKALNAELVVRKGDWSRITFDTIYFGGGTPSVLSLKEIIGLFKVIYNNYKINDNPEISFEANPDDLSNQYLSDLKLYTPINRLSIGVQSFNNADLLLMNRRHNANEAYEAIVNAQKAGFKKITIDLIYGIPGMNTANWESNLDKAINLNINHLSAYHLTFEPKTVFYHFQSKGTLKPVSESTSQQQYKLLINKTVDAGFENYEISNFAKDKNYSQHNLLYWTGKPYAGFGPSAHSYDGKTRRWNLSNNSKYINSIVLENNDYFDTETPDTKTIFNEYLMTSLRTMWGADLNYIRMKFGDLYVNHCLKVSDKFVSNKQLFINNNKLIITQKGKLVSDYVISELFVI